MYRVLCARESLREKRMEEGERYEFVSCGVKRQKTLTFQSKEELLVDFSKACDLFFALSSGVLVLLFFFSSRVVRVVEEGSIS
jgi:hypothetical protein